MKIKYILSTAYLLLPTALVKAQTITPELPTITPYELPITGQQVSLTKLTALANQIAEFLIQVAPIFAVIFLVWGGITYMAAGPDEEKTKNAKARIKNAIIGTIIIFGTGVILSTLSSIINRGTLQ